MAMEIVGENLQSSLGTGICQYPTRDNVGVTDFLIHGCGNLIDGNQTYYNVSKCLNADSGYYTKLTLKGCT